MGEINWFSVVLTTKLTRRRKPERPKRGTSDGSGAVGGRVQRLVRPVLVTYALSSSGTTAGIPDQVAIFKMCATKVVRA